MRTRLTQQTWGRLTKNVTLLSMTGTTTLKTTTNHLGTAVDLGDYRVGVFQVAVTANSTGAPKAILEGSNDNSNFFDIATISADLTTTANTSGVVISAMPRYVRSKITPYTTSVKTIHVNITGEVFV